MTKASDIPWGRPEQTPYDLIVEAEGRVGAELKAEFKGYFKLVRRLVNASSVMLRGLEGQEQPPASLEASCMILGRLVTDLCALCALVKSGYPGQAIALTPSIIELSYTLVYIGDDSERATEWLLHHDERQGAPWRFRKALKAVAERLGLDEAFLRREYEVLYRSANTVKHANPMAIRAGGILPYEDARVLALGPHSGFSARQWACSALQLGIRYVKFAAMSFSGDHVDETQYETFREVLKVIARDETAINAQFARTFNGTR